MASNDALAYDEISGFQGVHIKGKVTLKGKLPKPRRYNLVVSPDPYYCGRISDGKGWRLSSSIQLSRNQGISEVIVFLKDVQKGKPFSPRPQTLKAVNCRFSPYIALLHSGETATVENWDPVEHRLEIYQRTQRGGRFIFQRALPRNPKIQKSDFLIREKHGTHQLGSAVSYRGHSPGPLVFRCSFHEFMEAWVFVLDHPYFSMTDREGNFSITDIPSGEYTLVVWHPLGQSEKTIKIMANQTLKLNLEFRPDPLLYPEDDQKPNPFGIDLIGDSRIAPTVELQTWGE